jgi:hypothetical protein
MKKFIPKNEQRYWYLDGDINWPYTITICSDRWDSEVEDGFSNCFRTRSDANIAYKKIRKILG